MKRIVAGILAHVDSGKTTLSEGLLYASGKISKMGRVDHRNAFLDTNEIERDRGITIFSKQAVIDSGDTQITLLDTPGHVDFSAETERTLCVLDYAVLVVSGADGVQSHTETLWKLLSHYNIPVFIFVNKMDLPSAEKSKILNDMKKRLGEGCVDFSSIDGDFYENAATLSAELLDEYIENESISDNSIKDAVLSRKIFPCFFGSALKAEGVELLLDALGRFTKEKNCGNKFGAKVFKISEDEKGQRLTHLKITGGSLKVKDTVSVLGENQKVNEVRVYSGAGYKNVQEALPGDVCAVTGLSKTFPGEGLGIEHDSEGLMSEPVFTYSVRLEPDTDISAAEAAFKRLEQEETGLNCTFDEKLKKINVQIMGEIQLEVLKRVLADRFGINAEFEQGSIIYRETVANTVEGVGHYEPLRHYAEVHLLIEPGERGSGVVLASDCSEDILAKNWQRLILTHLAEKTHLGVLTGSPLTDVKITLINGRAHAKHTEGGDFRQATYRAVRQGLMQSESILLEPWYNFTLSVPLSSTGRSLTDLQRMGAKFEAPETDGEFSVIMGKAPISAVWDYHKSVTEYTRGRGRLSCVFGGYEPCANQQEVIEKIGYDCESDVENTADSVFCYHGSGQIVKWNDVFKHMHIPPTNLSKDKPSPEVRTGEYKRLIADEEELLKIFEMTYGKVNEKPRYALKTRTFSEKGRAKTVLDGPVYLLIDGYNIIFAWDELKKIAQDNLDLARALFINRVCNYQAMRQLNVILVFDAYKVKDAVRETEKIHGVTVVYTKTAETADAYIEKTSKELCKNYRVRVATSDNLEQMIVFGNGANRIPAGEFIAEVKEAERELKSYISREV